MVTMNSVGECLPSSDHAQQNSGVNQERDRHGVFAADQIGNRAPEDAAGAVGERVHQNRKRQHAAAKCSVFDMGPTCAVTIRPPMPIISAIANIM